MFLLSDTPREFMEYEMSEISKSPYENFMASLAAAERLSEELKNISVMLVDDHCYMRNLVERMLRDIGIQAVHIASGTDEALALITNGVAPLDLIICDLKMPGRDGFAFVDALRRHPDAAKARLPILIMTGFASPANIETLTKLGVQGVIAKPLTAKILKEHISAALVAPEAYSQEYYPGS